MLLTISTTHQPATDLGYLLAKHPDRHQSFELPFGTASVFYPEASEERCTVALLLNIDQVGLTRSKKPGTPAQQDHYVNDRAYAASSHLALALNKVFRSAAAGTCREKPELASTPIPLEARIPAAPDRASRSLVKRLFEPLGYHVEAERPDLDPRFPEWGKSPYVDLTLSHTVTLRELLNHLYVLLPVLDGEKHYYVSDDEVEKLVRFGEGWLSGHPQRELISQRFLKNQRGLVREALTQIPAAVREDAGEETAEEQERREQNENRLETPMKLAEQRVQAVIQELRKAGSKTVLDLGSGEGRLTLALLKDPEFRTVTAVETSHRALEIAARRVKRLPAEQQDRASLLHGSLTYRDERLKGQDAAVLMEVIEHIDPSRLDAFEDAVFAHARPQTAVITTPNREYNSVFGMAEGTLRHRDHRFEWTREEFQAWARAAGERNGYSVEFSGIGPEDRGLGAPTQMGTFRKEAGGHRMKQEPGQEEGPRPESVRGTLVWAMNRELRRRDPENALIPETEDREALALADELRRAGMAGFHALRRWVAGTLELSDLTEIAGRMREANTWDQLRDPVLEAWTAAQEEGANAPTPVQEAAQKALNITGAVRSIDRTDGPITKKRRLQRIMEDVAAAGRTMAEASEAQDRPFDLAKEYRDLAEEVR